MKCPLCKSLTHNDNNDSRFKCDCGSIWLYLDENKVPTQENVVAYNIAHYPNNNAQIVSNQAGTIIRTEDFNFNYAFYIPIVLDDADFIDLQAMINKLKRMAAFS